MAAFQTTPERTAKVAALREYFDAIADGDERAWIRIEADTGIKMDHSGRDMARTAIGKRPYESIRGVGIRFSCAETALQIAQQKVVRIDGAVRRADKTQTELQRRHLQNMSAPAQQRMLMLASFFGAVRTLATGARRNGLKA